LLLIILSDHRRPTKSWRYSHDTDSRVSIVNPTTGEAGGVPPIVGALWPGVGGMGRSVRYPTGTIHDRLRRLLGYRVPGVVPPETAVRGVGVAVENLVRCLFSRPGTWNIHLYSTVAASQVNRDLSLLGIPPSAMQHISICALAELAAHGFYNGQPPRIWYEPAAFYREAFQLRDRATCKPYPVVCTVHGLSDFRLMYEQFLRVMLCDTYQGDSLVCTSEPCRIALQKLLGYLGDALSTRYGVALTYRGRLDTIALPVDTNLFSPGDRSKARKTFHLGDSQLLVLYVGRMSFLKCDVIPILTAMVPYLREVERLDLVFGFAGTAEAGFLDRLHRFAGDIGIPASRLRIFVGIDDNSKVALLRAADIFISPSDSLQECFGIAPVEAMAVGVPQLVADWSGYKDTVVQGVTGFRVSTRWAACDEDLKDTGPLLGWYYDNILLSQTVAVDGQQWADALLRLASNRELRMSMGEASRSRAIQMYSMDSIRQQYHALWEEVSAVPKPLTASPKEQVDQLKYYSVFRHYASISVSDDAEISVTAMPPAISEVIIRHACSTLTINEGLDLNAIRRIMTETRKKGQVAIMELRRTACSNLSHSGTLRHIMWGVKHGLWAVNGGTSMIS